MPFVQYVASLAVLQAVQHQARSRLRDRGIDMRIKWPNDLYIGSLKVHDVVACVSPACRSTIVSIFLASIHTSLALCC